MVRSLLLITALLYTLSVQSQEDATRITTGFTYELPSKILDQVREVYISLPPGYDTMTQRPPVIFLLDGESRFNVSQGIIRYSQYSAMVPPAIIVGLANRNREERTLYYLPEEGSTPDRFLQHLAEEVIPYVDSTYANSGNHYLVGHSHGAVFALYVLLHSPELFRGYLASDPSVKFLLEPAATLLREQYDGQRLYLSSTDVAYGYAEEIKEDIHKDQATLVDILRQRSPEELAVGIDHITDDHGNGYVSGLSLGLRYLFFGWLRPQPVVASTKE